MAKLEGIIYKTFDHYVVLRGFAAIKDLAQISHRPKSYQRNADKEHKKSIIQFLASGEYKYFPEITLACRVANYTEFAKNIGIDNAVDRDDAQFVPGLKVLSERLPYEGYRARHASLTKNANDELVRVDGNHRLEIFDENNEALWDEAKADKLELEKLIVPFTVIFSEKEFGDKFEAGIFHNINFKQLPLRQEASLRIIHDIGAFDNKESLGKEYPLALDLIEVVKTGQFNAIPWLSVVDDISKSYYRTTCLSIARLLISQKETLYLQRKECVLDLKKTRRDISSIQNEMNIIEETVKAKFDEIQELELNQTGFEEMVTYKKLKLEISQIQEQLKLEQNNHISLEYKIAHLEYKATNLRRYLKSCENSSIISEALTLLVGVYRSFSQEAHGNIAFLCALVYYAILDKMQMQSFIDWAERNGINKIIEPDDLSKDSAVNLIMMFEQIYQAKKNEIFISMQFGDSQSELIYEKITRAIERFNEKHKSIRLNATPIRIDRTVESSTFSIQDRILEAIKSCSLIIADLSSSNINVYHEIGYAMGVAESHNMIPNMILLYKEDTNHNKEKKDIDKFVGFNLRNLSQLRFKDYKQLVDGLVDRLEKHYGV
ncbi:hypothetical protein [Alistipes sp. CHKCI003]|uniref:Uncharacterized protein n=1 Tax=Candidatus Caccoplasma intestinavium TaxID=2840716 RepID=A0A9D1GD51_9BACT|nr:hypothetical protein [Alistipes sp. CHKCI003]CVI65120.1 hypothetical protein BN3659_00060 [Alistipes sp. CHKCI003]HIT38820.1 hypothetical protein [Candidatus Caccoplasma intestinavium]